MAGALPGIFYTDEFLEILEESRLRLAHGRRAIPETEAAVRVLLLDAGLRHVATAPLSAAGAEELWTECTVPLCQCTPLRKGETQPRPSGLLEVMRAPYMAYGSSIGAYLVGSDGSLALSQSSETAWRHISPCIRAARSRKRRRLEPAATHTPIGTPNMSGPCPYYMRALREWRKTELARGGRGRWPPQEEQRQMAQAAGYLHGTSPSNLEHKANVLRVSFSRGPDGVASRDWTEKDTRCLLTKIEAEGIHHLWPVPALRLVVVVGGAVKHKGAGCLYVSTPLLRFEQTCFLRQACVPPGSLMTECHTFRRPGPQQPPLAVMSSGGWSLRAVAA
jgi:hypothetical protein